MYNKFMNKIKKTFTLSKESFDVLNMRAHDEHRSMSSHIEHLIMQDLKYSKIPVVGKVDDVADVEYLSDPTERG